MSVPEVAGIRLSKGALDIVELSARRGRLQELQALVDSQGLKLPSLGRASMAPDRFALCVRPGRWLVLSSPGEAGAAAAGWDHRLAGMGMAVDQSSGLAVFLLAGAARGELLARGCRLDLHPQVFPAGSAAATLVAQVAVMLVALPAATLLLTPATTSRHFCEWLESTARPFGLSASKDFNVQELFRSELR